ncbi:MAG: gliding motility-associated ABC transporter permease subunit GldF [Spirosomaceae bacterium]|nr:gliding motility-associated ABC transporter permease subunit GldF [Spirosomataceae bacterium]
MQSIFLKELNAYFSSAVAYLVIGVFLVFTGLVTWVFPDSNVLDYGFSDLGSFFQLTPYLFFFFVPALTMRLFADEFRVGTFELLLTKPISLWQLILGKFFAAWLTIAAALVLTIIYYTSIYQLGSPIGNIDTAAVIGAYAGLFLLAAAFVSIGIFTSSLTDNQIIAFVIGMAICIFFYEGIHQFSQLFSGETQFLIDYLSLQTQFVALGRGVIDSRNVIYLVSISVFFLYCSYLKLLSKSR